MAPFLWQVARHYLDAECLEDYCFVFPNRRSGQFFTRYLQEQLVAGNPKPRLLPSVMSINDLITELTATVTATDIEMMFALYDAYCRAMGDAAQEFDQFIYWAHLIIGDFNDIDKSLANPDEIYQNLSDLHGLTSNYLSPEVQEQVKKIFGENRYQKFMEEQSNAEYRDEVRNQIVANYVADNNLAITKIQDYGWDPVELPEANSDSFTSFTK